MPTVMHYCVAMRAHWPIYQKLKSKPCQYSSFHFSYFAVYAPLRVDAKGMYSMLQAYGNMFL